MAATTSPSTSSCFHPPHPLQQPPIQLKSQSQSQTETESSSSLLPPSLSQSIPSLENQTMTSTTKSKMTIQRHHRRTNNMMVTQMKLIVFLLSLLLHIGDSPYWMQPSGGRVPLLGNVFVMGETTTLDEIDEVKKRKLPISSSRSRRGGGRGDGTGTTRNTVADLPSFSSAFQKDSSKPSLKSFKFNNGDKNETKQLAFSSILKKAGKSGIGGGLSGAVAGVVQVLSLMWLRTVMNYQCRYGSTFLASLKKLYNEGGIPRFYRGLSFALIQAPLARFVATASNDGVETFLSSFPSTKQWGPGRSTVIASMVVGMWRMFLMPIDTCKTVLQVDSVDGFRGLMRKVKAGKIYVLYNGAVANAVSAIASHYPWFYTFRILSNNRFLQKLIGSNHLRNAVIGFVSSVVSDTFANSIRVVKTTKQAIASKQSASYGDVIAMILAVDGFKGLFGRGLRTRILGNALQSVLFTVIWRSLAERRSNSQQGSGESPRRTLEEEDEAAETSIDEMKETDVPMEEERF